MRCVLLLSLSLAACGADLPPVEGSISAAARARPWPELVPLDPLLAEGTRPSRAAAAGVELLPRGTRIAAATVPAPDTADLPARGAALRRAAAAASGPGGSDMLAERADRLRARAEDLRAAPL